MVNSILGSGITGIQRGVSTIKEGASEIASADAARGDTSAPALTGSLIDLKVGLHQVQASALVIETVDQVLNAVIGATDRR